MSIEKKEEIEQLFIKPKNFLGQKTKFPSEINILIQTNKCQICGNYENICKNCSKTFCHKCIRQITQVNLNKIKESEYLCQNCQKIRNNKIEKNIKKCDIYRNKFQKKILVSSMINKEENNKLKNDFKNKEISLSDEDEDLYNNFFLPMNLCNKFFSEKNKTTKKIEDKRKEPNNKDSINIIDLLINEISKEKDRETNVFNILDNINGNTLKIDGINNTVKEKGFNKENEINNLEIEKNKDLKNDLKGEVKPIIDNNIKNNFENLNNLEFQNLFLKDNINNINNLKINNNSNLNESSTNIPSENIPEKDLLLETNINTSLKMVPPGQIPPSININSNNKTTQIYLPNFLSTSPLTNSQNIGSFLSNINNQPVKNINDLKNQNFLQNNSNNSNLNEMINKLMELDGQMNINDINLNQNDMNKEYLFDSTNSLGKDFNINKSNNLDIMNCDIRTLINSISKDLHSFENNNTQNNLNILNNMQLITDIFSNLISPLVNKKDNSETIINKNNCEIINHNSINSQKIVDNISKDINKKHNNNENKSEEENNEINNQQKKENNQNNTHLIENPSTNSIIKYILTINETLKSQLKRLKIYIEIKKKYFSLIYKNLDKYNQFLNQEKFKNQTNDFQNKEQNILNDPNKRFPQMKCITSENNNNDLISQKMPFSTFSLNSPNLFSSTLINSQNINFNPPIPLSPISPILPNNNSFSGISLLNFPGYTFKQEFPLNFPNTFATTPLFPLNLGKKRGANVIGDPIIGHNISEMIPNINVIEPINPIENNMNDLQFSNSQNKTSKNIKI